MFGQSPSSILKSRYPQVLGSIGLAWSTMISIISVWMMPIPRLDQWLYRLISSMAVHPGYPGLASGWKRLTLMHQPGKNLAQESRCGCLLCQKNAGDSYQKNCRNNWETIAWTIGLSQQCWILPKSAETRHFVHLSHQLTHHLDHWETRSFDAPKHQLRERVGCTRFRSIDYQRGWPSFICGLWNWVYIYIPLQTGDFWGLIIGDGLWHCGFHLFRPYLIV